MELFPIWFATFDLGHHIFFLVESKTFTTILYGLSVLSGPALAIAVASIRCLVPYHNVLEEPCFWYESILATLFAVIPFVVWLNHPLTTEYWSNFSMKKSFNTYLFLLLVASGIYITVIAIFYYYWGDLAPPLPFNGFIAGSTVCLVIWISVILR